MDIAAWLDKRAITPKGHAENKKQAFALISESCAKAFNLESDKVLSALWKREQQGSTGVGVGVAIPHACLDHLNEPKLIFLRLNQPIEFDSADEKPVDLILALLLPKEQETLHLRALAKLSRILRLAKFRESLRKAVSSDSLYALMVEELDTEFNKT